MVDDGTDSDADEDALAQPAGSGDYVVSNGDCFASIAYEHGFFWETLWKLPENADLRNARKDPNILMAGDRVTIPDITPKSVTRATGARHQFRRRGVPERVRLRLTDEVSGDRKSLDYELYIDDADQPRRGSTNEQGLLDEWIPPNARKGRLVLPNGETIALAFGNLDPVNSYPGARARLINLRLMAPGEDFDAALVTFQENEGLDVSGELDEATQAKLVELHGC